MPVGEEESNATTEELVEQTREFDPSIVQEETIDTTASQKDDDAEHESARAHEVDLFFVQERTLVKEPLEDLYGSIDRVHSDENDEAVKEESTERQENDHSFLQEEKVGDVVVEGIEESSVIVVEKSPVDTDEVLPTGGVNTDDKDAVQDILDVDKPCSSQAASSTLGAELGTNNIDGADQPCLEETNILRLDETMAHPPPEEEEDSCPSENKKDLDTSELNRLSSKSDYKSTPFEFDDDHLFKPAIETTSYSHETDDIRSVGDNPKDKFADELKQEAVRIINDGRSVDSVDVLSVRSELSEYFPEIMTELQELSLARKRFRPVLKELQRSFAEKQSRKSINLWVLMAAVAVLLGLLKLTSTSVLHQSPTDVSINEDLELRLRIIEYEI